MNANSNFEDEDLVLYAMHLLVEPEVSTIARRLAEDRDTRQRFEVIQAELGFYAEAQVELKEAPDGSLHRLMEQIAREKEIKLTHSIPMKATPASPPRHLDLAKIVSWIGWALAAGLLVAVGTQQRDRMVLRKSLSEVVARKTADDVAFSGERSTLQNQVARQTEQLQLLQMNLRGLRGNATGAENASQMADLARAKQDRDDLRKIVAAQADQIAQLATAAANGRQMLEALRDPGALRITLTKPKSKVVPTARVTYIAERGTLIFLANDLASLKTNKVYQLWLMPVSGSNPIPAGTFVPDAQGNASVIYTQFPEAIPAKGFSVTIENDGGSKTPTLPIILAGLRPDKTVDP